MPPRRKIASETAVKVPRAPGTPNGSMSTGSIRTDGWNNFAMGAGVQGRDKLESSAFQARERLSDQQCSDLYRQNWLAKLMVNALAVDCTRAGYTLELADQDTETATGEANDIATAVYAAWDRLHVMTRLRQGLTWALVFRGAVALKYTDEEIDAVTAAQTQSNMQLATILKTPLDETKIIALKQLQIVDARFAIPDMTVYDTNLDSPNFGNPLFYTVTPYGTSSNTSSYTVHWSRLLRFEGVETDMLTRIKNLTWGDSIYEVAWDVLMRYGMVYQGVSIAASEFAVKMMKVKDLDGSLGSDKMQALFTRMQGLKMSLGAFGIGLLDSDGEDLEFMGQPVTGLADLANVLKEEVAGMLGKPQSQIWGSAQGKLAGAEVDNENWAQKVDGWQEANVTPNLYAITRTLFLSKEGPTGGVEPKGWSLKPNPLAAPNLEKELEQKKLLAEIMHIFFADGVLEPSEIRESLFGGAKFSFEIVLDAIITEVIKRRELAEQKEPAESEEPPEQPEA